MDDSVDVVLSAHQPQLKSHMCAPEHVGQYTTSQSYSVWLHTSRQSSYFQQVVVVSVAVLMLDVELLVGVVCVYDDLVLVVSVPVRVVSDPVETEVLVVPLVVVPVIVVVVVVVMVVTVVEPVWVDIVDVEVVQ